MKLKRPSEFAISPNNTFENDRLDRKECVIFLKNLIKNIEGPFVLALDSPWGTGKTAVVNMLKAELTHENYQCVYFNAWEVDYVIDPLVALISAIDEAGFSGPVDLTLHKGMKTIKKIASSVVKNGAVAGVKIVTAGLVDVSNEVNGLAADLAADATKNLIDVFQEEKKSLAQLKNELKKVVGQLVSPGKKNTLIFFVDELDRCKPTFAIEVLERIKHIFNVPNIVFVLSVDRRQLEAITAAVYGEKINAPEYLRKFIDVEYSLPGVDDDKYMRSLFEGVGLTGFFDYELEKRGKFGEYFFKISALMDLPLRAQERCVIMLSIVMIDARVIVEKYYELMSILIILRVANPDIFEKLKKKKITAMNVFEGLESHKGWKTLEMKEEMRGCIETALAICSDEWSNSLKGLVQDVFESYYKEKREQGYYKSRNSTSAQRIANTFVECYGCDLRNFAIYKAIESLVVSPIEEILRSIDLSSGVNVRVLTKTTDSDI